MLNVAEANCIGWTNRPGSTWSDHIYTQPTNNEYGVHRGCLRHGLPNIDSANVPPFCHACGNHGTILLGERGGALAPVECPYCNGRAEPVVTSANVIAPCTVGWELLGSSRTNTSSDLDGRALNVPLYDVPDPYRLARIRRAVEYMPRVGLAMDAVAAATEKAAKAMAALGVAASSAIVRLKSGPHSLTMGLRGGKVRRYKRGQAYRLASEEAKEALDTGRFELVEESK